MGMSSSALQTNDNKANENIDLFFQQYHDNKDTSTLKMLAELLKEGYRPQKYHKDNPQLYKKYINKMQNMGLMGKDNDEFFTRSEIERTQTRLESKDLNIHKEKKTGKAKGIILSSDHFKETGKPRTTNYMVKQGTPFEHLHEVIGGRFYQAFSGEYGNLTAKTRLLYTEDAENPFIKVEGKLARNEKRFNTASRILPYYRSYSETGSLPKIIDNKIVLQEDSKPEKEIKGYISMLVTAKFIHDLDAIGYGSNSGYSLIKRVNDTTRNVYYSNKIDPGRSFGFEERLFGLSVHLQKQLSGAEVSSFHKKDLPSSFHTHPPLELFDLKNIPHLRPGLGAIKTALDLIYPTIDPRDLLLGEMTYAQIAQSPKAYKQMSKAVSSIARCKDEDLSYLINYNIPDTLNGTSTREERTYLLAELQSRRDVIKQLYAPEIEYMNLYRAAKNRGVEINFEQMKRQAAENVNANLNPDDLPIAAIKMTNSLKEECSSESRDLLRTVLLQPLAILPDKENIAKNMILAMEKDGYTQAIVNAINKANKQLLLETDATKSNELYYSLFNVISASSQALQEKNKTSQCATLLNSTKQSIARSLLENLQKEGLEHDDNFNKANTLLDSYGKTTNEKISLIASVLAYEDNTQKIHSLMELIPHKENIENLKSLLINIIDNSSKLSNSVLTELSAHERQAISSSLQDKEGVASKTEKLLLHDLSLYSILKGEHTKAFTQSALGSALHQLKAFFGANEREGSSTITPPEPKRTRGRC